MKIAVIDGQGGGMGKLIIERLRQELRDKVEIYALGTNAVATAAMLKAGANEGATGENAIQHCCNQVDLIVGSLSIIVANSMLGELTPNMSTSVATSKAKKVLIPIHRCNIDIVGIKSEPLPHFVDGLIMDIKKALGV